MKSQFREAFNEAVTISEESFRGLIVAFASVSAISASQLAIKIPTIDYLLKSGLVLAAIITAGKTIRFREARCHCIENTPTQNENQWMKINSEYIEESERLLLDDKVQNASDARSAKLKFLRGLEAVLFLLIFAYLLAALYLPL